MNAIEANREELYKKIESSGSLVYEAVLKQSMELDKLILEVMKPKGGIFTKIKDCKECSNKGTDLCKPCIENSGKRPSSFISEVQMHRQKIYPNYWDNFYYYEGKMAIKLVRTREGKPIYTNYIEFDSPEEAMDYFENNCGS